MTSNVQRDERWQAEDQIWQVLCPTRLTRALSAFRAILGSLSLGRKDVGFLFVKIARVEIFVLGNLRNILYLNQETMRKIYKKL